MSVLTSALSEVASRGPTRVLVEGFISQGLDGIDSRPRGRFDDRHEVLCGIEKSIVKKRKISPQNKRREKRSKKENRGYFRDVLRGSVNVSKEGDVLGERERKAE